MERPREVTLVIPGRNCASTLPQCLAGVCDIRDRSPDVLRRIIYVDDGSTDDSREIAATFPVDLIEGPGRGPAAARNLGMRSATTELVWFVDSDCVAEPEALDKLVPHMDDANVGGVSGSYGIMNPSSLLARLIHEEIIERHIRMASLPRVDFLATFNVLYRRAIIDGLNGFDQRYLKGQDAELSFRVMEAGHDLAFEFDSRVRHFHEERWGKYLRTQRQQGHWRVYLHLEHPGHSAGDSYSSLIDHLQPPLALLAVLSLPLVAAPLVFESVLAWLLLVPAGLLALLGLFHLPMTLKLLRRTRDPKMIAFWWMSMLRSFWRSLGMSTGTLAYAGSKLRSGKSAS